MENLRDYRYATNGYTMLDNLFNPWWEFVTRCYPEWLAPNLITLLGLIFPIATTIIIDQMHPTLTEPYAPWLVSLVVFSNFWYQTLDATDGKQARRTDNCSPLGQILDHNLD